MLTDQPLDLFGQLGLSVLDDVAFVQHNEQEGGFDKVFDVASQHIVGHDNNVDFAKTCEDGGSSGLGSGVLNSLDAVDVRGKLLKPMPGQSRRTDNETRQVHLLLHLSLVLDTGHDHNGLKGLA
jgi:hypothetical protein